MPRRISVPCELLCCRENASWRGTIGNWDSSRFLSLLRRADKRAWECSSRLMPSVLVRDIATQRDTKLPMQSAVEVSDDVVEKMLSDSLEHAFDDIGERAFAEACLKADEMLPAVETALRRLGGEVAPEEREKISQLVRQVQEARETHSLSSLKTALSGLDKLTEPLAAKLVEEIMQGRL